MKEFFTEWREIAGGTISLANRSVHHLFEGCITLAAATVGLAVFIVYPALYPLVNLYDFALRRGEWTRQ